MPPMPSMTASRFLDRRTPPSTGTLILLTSLAALSMNLFLPSLPGMTAYFDTEYGIIQIAVAGYLLVSAFMQVIIGPIADRYGRRRVMLGAIAIFVAASFGCVVAPNVELFLAFRMVQATIVAGLVVPRAAIRDMYDQARAAAMIGWVTMGMSVAPMVAPAFGGVLDGAFGWQANFVALGLAGAVCFALAWADMGETAIRATSSLRQQIAEYPALLTAPRFWGYALTAATASGAFFAYLGGAPYVGSVVFDLTPEALGIYFGAPAIGYMFGNGISGSFSARVGICRMIAIGTLVTVAGLAFGIALFLAGLGSPLSFFGCVVFVGLGNGLVIPNSMAGMLSVRPHLAGTASGLGGAIMIGGGAGLSALAGWLLGGGDSAMPLLILMIATACGSVLCIAFTIRRERRLATQAQPISGA